MTEAVIVSTARTPIGKAYRGALNNTEGPTMAGHVIGSEFHVPPMLTQIARFNSLVRHVYLSSVGGARRRLGFSASPSACPTAAMPPPIGSNLRQTL